MFSSDDILPRKFGDEYDRNLIFDEIKIIQDFYGALSFGNIQCVEHAAILSKSMVFSTSTYIYGSIEGTMESISVLLHNGRCNDAFALVRKYCDAIILDIYKNILTRQNYDEVYNNLSLESIKNSKIRRWIDAESSLFEQKEILSVYKTISKEFPELSSLFKLSDKSTLYHKLRDICNDNMHYNYLYNMMANDAGMIKARKDLRDPILKSISQAIRLFFIIHFTFIYVGNTTALMSSDYMDHLECGIQPPEGSERWVSYIVKLAFDSIINKYSNKATKYILNLNLMDL